MSTPEEDQHFVTLLLANQNRIFRFLMTLVPSRSDAEDLLQQTCVTLWQNRSKFDPAAGEFSSWACATAHNHVRNFRRKETTRKATLSHLSEEVLDSLLHTREMHGSLLDEWHRALALCIERLTPKQRALVKEGYSAANLKSSASGAGRSPNALYKVLRHVRAILHDCIQKNVREGGAA
jgi:RNA polymerase sigma-70 factor (ECF subfamily)